MVDSVAIFDSSSRACGSAGQDVGAIVAVRGTVSAEDAPGASQLYAVGVPRGA